MALFGKDDNSADEAENKSADKAEDKAEKKVAKATGKETHEVTHNKLYMAVKGKLQHVKPGTLLTLTKKQATSLGKKVISLADKKEAAE